MKEPTIITLGCRLNAHESDIALAHARSAGVLDAVIVNTCAVTTESVRQAAQTIRRVRRERPMARIIATGCAVELEPGKFASMPAVDAVIGNTEKLDAATYRQMIGANGLFMATGGASSARKVAEPPGGIAPRTRAILAVQNGCDHRCTFCIIPFARGPSRSMSIDEAVSNVQKFVDAGHKEVVLTGVDLTSYRMVETGEPGLGSLVRAILRRVPGLKRLRLSTVDPAEVDEDLVECFASQPRLMPHLHLSLQSGDDMILKRMKRRHSRATAVAVTDRLRAVRPDIVFGADLIAGFPTESETMFATTLSTIADCQLTYLHVFPYSPRPGTPAARMPQLDAKIVVARAARLRQEGSDRLAAYLTSEVGMQREVLAERGGRGRTPHFADVVIEGAPAAGTLLVVKIVGHDGMRLIAQPAARDGDESQAVPSKVEVRV